MKDINLLIINIMKRKNIYYLFLLVMVFTSCEVDNYNLPDGDIYGKLTDMITNENFQSEQPNGFNIKLYEKGGMQNIPITFSGKPDGTFERTLIFQNEYKVLPTEGAFFKIDTVSVNVGSRTEVNFDVVPYLALTNVTVTPEVGKVTVSYKIARQTFETKINQRQTLVSDVNTVNNTVFTFRKQTILTSISDATILATTYTDVVTGLTSGKTYWVRVGARTGNTLSRFNYSKVYEVKIP